MIVGELAKPSVAISDPRATKPMSRGPAHVMASASLALFALAYVVLGLAGSMVLLSAVLLAAGLGQAFTGLRGPASWAAGIVGTFGMILGCSALLGAASPRSHGSAVNLAILLAPAIVGVCLMVYSRRINRDGPHYPNSYSAVPALVAGLFLTVAGAVSSLGKYNGIAWAMSGDARNHVAIFRGILSQGGVGVSTFLEYPAGVSAFTAMLAGAGDRSGTVGEVMVNDIRAMASTYVLAAIALGVLTTAALLETRYSGEKHVGPISWPLLTTLLVASASAGTGFMLGIALDDGFLSAYGALPLSLASIVLGLRYVSIRRGGLVPFLFLGVAVPLAFVSWTPVAIVPAAILVCATVVAVRDLVADGRPDVGSSVTAPLGSARTRWWLAIAGSAAGLVGVGCVVVLTLPRLEAKFVLTGSARSPYSLMIIVLLLVVVALGIATSGRMVSRQMVVPMAAGVAGGLVVTWLVGLPGPGVTWSYYALKTNWLVSSSMLWVLFVPIVLWVESRSSLHSARGRSAVAALSMSLAVLMLSGSASTSQGPVAPAARGWIQPSAQVVELAVEGANAGRPFIFWDGDDPANDRLGNLWAALAWGSEPSGRFLDLPGVPGGVGRWAYFETGKTSELCELITAAPGIVVYTRNDDLEGQLAESCSASEATVVVYD